MFLATEITISIDFGTKFTVDYAELEDGSWKIIEAGDGQVSGLAEYQDYDQYLRVLYEYINE